MNRRILSVIIAVLGLIAIALAVCSATIWRPSSTAQASLAAAPTQNYVVTEPGVLSLVDSDVTVTATAASSDEDVVIAVGHSSDVKAWLATDPYVSVTGLTDWETLKSTEITTTCQLPATQPTEAPSAASTDAATAAASDAATAAASSGECTALESSGADPTSSDLWLATEAGTGSATLELDATDTDLVVLVATNGSDPAPQVSLSWPRSVSTPWLVPGLVVGGLLLLAGVFLFLVDIQVRHADAQRRARAAERAARLARADSVSTAGIPQVTDPDRPLSRRELRDKERAEAAGEEWIDPRTGQVSRGGVEVPAVPAAPAFDADSTSVLDADSTSVLEAGATPAEAGSPAAGPFPAGPGAPVAPAPSPGSPVTPVPGPGGPVQPAPSPGSPVTPVSGPGGPVMPTPSPGSPVMPAPSTGSPVMPAPSTGSPVFPVPAAGEQAGAGAPVGPARGSAVVPGLSQQDAAAYRAGREVPSAPFAVTDQEPDAPGAQTTGPAAGTPVTDPSEEEHA
ncbi:hypothetical protein [Actinomyces howellii]|uniref:Uncharacterized protein n=1 Tax=Actinomyces howellii TaxID=52771 RepID=A0A448HKB5_9ACTO|nr:hypothetical protein [Actinomyces howellii]VEG30058.1 Uncharacterised protein [Actinomyces howellii]